MDAQIQGKQDKRSERWDIKKITYFENYKKNVNFTYMQSMCLIAGYLAAANRECLDQRMFMR